MIRVRSPLVVRGKLPVTLHEELHKSLVRRITSLFPISFKHTTLDFLLYEVTLFGDSLRQLVHRESIFQVNRKFDLDLSQLLGVNIDFLLRVLSKKLSNPVLYDLSRGFLLLVKEDQINLLLDELHLQFNITRHSFVVAKHAR